MTEGEICSFKTNTQQELIVHYKHFHEVKCQKCSLRCNSLTDLKQHEKVHMKKNQWCSCPFCDGHFKEKNSLVHHIKESHQYRQEPKKMGCGQCDFETNDSSEIKEHIMKTHNNDSCVSCSQCRYKTTSNKKLDDHIKAKHSMLKPVCKFFLEGKCTRQGCTYRHEKPESSNNQRYKEKCNKGSSCYHKSQNRCHFYHPEGEVQQVQGNNSRSKRHQQPHENRSQVLWCQYQDNCVDTDCPFKHFRNTTFSPTQRRGSAFL